MKHSWMNVSDKEQFVVEKLPFPIIFSETARASDTISKNTQNPFRIP